MFKLKFSLCLLPFLCSCSVTTKITGQFIFDNSFRAMKEFSGEIEYPQSEHWFKFESIFELHPDFSYELKLVYFDGTEKTFSGNYCIYVGDEGHSGKGYFTLEEEKLDLTFKESYFLIFDLPTYLNPEGNEQVRTLYFQRW